MIKLKDLLSEGKWGIKGKYLTMPGGQISSIPGDRDRDAIIVDFKQETFRISIKGSKPYALGNSYDKDFRNVNDLVKWLNKEKAKYLGIDRR